LRYFTYSVESSPEPIGSILSLFYKDEIIGRKMLGTLTRVKGGVFINDYATFL
jgi:hypothetical protein